MLAAVQKRLVPDAWKVFRHAWSFRFWMLSAACQGVSLTLQTALSAVYAPPLVAWSLSIAAGVFAVLGLGARFYAQRTFRPEADDTEHGVADA